MGVAGLILTVVGIMLLGCESLGKVRAEAMEKGLLQLGRRTRTLFGSVVRIIVLPRKRLDARKDESRILLPWMYSKWVLWPFLGVSAFSLIFVAPRMESTYVLPNETLRVHLWVIGLGSYATLIIGTMLSMLLILVMEKAWRRGVVLGVFSTALVPIEVGLLVLVIIAFVGTMAFSYPAIVIFGSYVALYGITHLVCSFIEWKDSVGAGNFFIILGTVMSLIGVVLLYVS